LLGEKRGANERGKRMLMKDILSSLFSLLFSLFAGERGSRGKQLSIINYTPTKESLPNNNQPITNNE